MKNLELQSYEEQIGKWPPEGRVLLAQYEPKTIVVYQAFEASTGQDAAANGRFGPGFSLNRMSWIKTNFTWMMYRSAWGTAKGQECVLAIWMQRKGFDQILKRAVPSSFMESAYYNQAEWKRALAGSEVRLQWDPDHSPHGSKLKRRAIQLGLSGETLRQYAEEWIVEIQDISALVKEQSHNRDKPETLMTPVEMVYPVKDQVLARQLGLDLSMTKQGA